MQRQKSSSFAVFPFLKTSSAVSIGGLSFRSTEDTAHLSSEEAEHVRTIASLLFLKDDLRVRSASYTVVPRIDFDQPDGELERLARIQAFVAYAYTAPHPTSGDPFLSTEHAHLVLFDPGPVSVFLVRPDHHVELTEAACDLAPNGSHEVPGYSCLYSLRHRFWAAKGSRVYGALPHITLNISQDLSMLAHSSGPDLDLLGKSIADPSSETIERILTAIDWFNIVNAELSDDAMALVALAIAFESMLRLPEGDRKSGPLAEAISLLLGRVPRLDNWALQFYRARSAIVHEGRAQHLHFFPSDKSRPDDDSAKYRSLLSYGRQIFRLCVGTLLTGAELAERAGLQDALVTNQERFEAICKVLDDETQSADARLEQVVPLVHAADRLRFVAETGLRIESLLGAARLSASALLEVDPSLDASLRKSLEELSTAKRSDDHYEELDALSRVKHSGDTVTSQDHPAATAYQLIEIVWHYTFMHYYLLREQRTSGRLPDDK